MVFPNALKDHLASGATTVARAYAIERKDGLVLGFTDHDRDLGFDGIQFHADSGLTAKALQQATGLAVDNTEAFGALRSDTITEADIAAGRYDGAEVRGWLVNWTDVSERVLQFRGTIGEVVRSGGAFTAELRGLTEALNQPQGRLYHARCSAVLGATHAGTGSLLSGSLVAPSCGNGRAVVCSTCFTSAGVSVGRWAITSAAAPATMGDAKLVPTP